MDKFEDLNINGCAAVYERIRRLINGRDTVSNVEELKGWIMLENLYKKIKPFEYELNHDEDVDPLNDNIQGEVNRNLLIVHKLFLCEAIHLYEDKGRHILDAERIANRLLSGECQLPQVQVENQHEEQSEPQKRVLPDELSGDKALIYWKKAKESGFVDDDYKFIGTNAEMVYFARLMADNLDMFEKSYCENIIYNWKPFQELWGYRYFPQVNNKIKDGFMSVRRRSDIEHIFE